MTTERQLFDFLCKHCHQTTGFVTGTRHTYVETHDLARTLDNWLRAEGGWTPPEPAWPAVATCANIHCCVAYETWRDVCPTCKMPNPHAQQPGVGDRRGR
jgi:hypothetical protein